MSYDLARLPIQTLLQPAFAAGSALSRLDERVARSAIGAGFLERCHFSDACASLWLDGELVHLEDLVLHDAGADVRAPTHELTIARDVLKSRRRISAQPPGWALGLEGLRTLRGQGRPGASDDAGSAAEKEGTAPDRAATRGGEGADGTEFISPLDAAFAAIDAVMARSQAALDAAISTGPTRARERDPLVYDPAWDEDNRLEDWRGVLREIQDLPAVLQAIVAVDAWNQLVVLQHAPWLGRLLAAALLRQAGLTTAAHLATVNLGLKTIPVDRRRHRHRETRLLAIAQGLLAAAEIGLKEHDRLALARTMLERKLEGRRSSSRLPELVELVMARPLVSAGMVARTLDVTPQAARRIVSELGLREITGRGRFRAWGVI